MLKPTRIVLN